MKVELSALTRKCLEVSVQTREYSNEIYATSQLNKPIGKNSSIKRLSNVNGTCTQKYDGLNVARIECEIPIPLYISPDFFSSDEHRSKTCALNSGNDSSGTNIESSKLIGQVRRKAHSRAVKGNILSLESSIYFSMH
jgi:hypothetical protein